MRVLDQGDLLRKELDGARSGGATVGLVLTMGALHAGHASLIRRSATECELTAVSVFVNPLQFGPAEDRATYPRDLDGDIEVAAAAGAGVVFAPGIPDMYPTGPPAVSVRVGGDLTTSLEGASRPGHFDGVATVVAKLFNLAGPCRAYFGEKDWEQLGVVRRLVADLSFPVTVVGCPIVREADGLACSSRNARLSPTERVAATVLYRALETATRAFAAGEDDLATLRGFVAGTVDKESLATLDYAAVVPDDVLPEGDVLLEGTGFRLVVAARIGAVRLIDNVHIELPGVSH